MFQTTNCLAQGDMADDPDPDMQRPKNVALPNIVKARDLRIPCLPWYDQLLSLDDSTYVYTLLPCFTIRLFNVAFDMTTDCPIS